MHRNYDNPLYRLGLATVVAINAVAFAPSPAKAQENIPVQDGGQRLPARQESRQDGGARFVAGAEKQREANQRPESPEARPLWSGTTLSMVGALNRILVDITGPSRR